MIRPALEKDIPAIARTYDALLAFEKEHGTSTNWAEGVYPTIRVPEEKVPKGEMFVAEEDGVICASMVLNHEQAEEYRTIRWLYPAEDGKVLVIHTLCIPPAMAGRGYGSAMVRYALDAAAGRGCSVVRIDTWVHNEPAKALYRKLGFRIAGTASALHQGVIRSELCYLEYRLG